MKQHSFPVKNRQPGDDEESLQWILLDGEVEADRSWVERQCDLSDIIKENLLASPDHNKRLHVDSAIVLSLVHKHASEDDELIGMSILIEAQRIITVYVGSPPVMEEIVRQYGLAEEQINATKLLCILVAALVKPIEGEITRLTDALDDLEDQIMSDEREQSERAVVSIGRQVLGARRYIVPMRDEFSFLAFNPEEFPGQAEGKYLRRTADYFGRLVNLLDSSHNRVTLLLQYLRSRDEAHLTKAMHKLTIVATVFLPLTFLTGLLGINVAGIPDAHDPRAFWLVCGFLTGIAFFALLFLRWRHWM